MEKKETRGENLLSQFIEKNVSYIGPHGSVVGQMNLPNFEGGYVDFLPNIGYEPNGRAYLEKETPVRLSLNYFGKDMIYTLREFKGDLEKQVNETNSRIGHKTFIGFGGNSNE